MSYIWHTNELLGYAYYAEKGYRILVSLVDGKDYDFVIEKSGVFKRVNVKTAFLKDKKQDYSWAVSRASGSNIYKLGNDGKNVDILLVWLPKDSRFIELPGNYLCGIKSKSKRIHKEFL